PPVSLLRSESTSHRQVYPTLLSSPLGVGNR
ncbi:hypothetical protein LCGC14_2833180, partial [marine sediment metagenome]